MAWPTELLHREGPVLFSFPMTKFQYFISHGPTIIFILRLSRKNDVLHKVLWLHHIFDTFHSDSVIQQRQDIHIFVCTVLVVSTGRLASPIAGHGHKRPAVPGSL